ncbi:DUF6578 domain-containing protein [Breznakiellaceae bacterium SP9]
MNECAVWIEDWQMQCCGKPFAIGDTVEWLALKWTGTDSEIVNVGKTDYLYDHHSSDFKGLFKIQGVVAHIEAIFYHYEEKQMVLAGRSGNFMIPVSGKVRSVESANGWEKDADGMDFAAYHVALRKVNIEAARQKDITFS